MKIDGSAKQNAIYKMRIHVNGVHRYASTQPFTIGEDGKRHYTRKHWGSLDEDLRFYPNTAFLYLSNAERRKLVFPQDWDLSELDKLRINRRRIGVVREGDGVGQVSGATWFLDRLSEKIGLTADLKKVFGGDMEMVNDVLTLVYYPFVTGASLDRLALLQQEDGSRACGAARDRRTFSPDGVPCCVDAVRLTQKITGGNFSDLLRLRASDAAALQAGWGAADECPGVLSDGCPDDCSGAWRDVCSDVRSDVWPDGCGIGLSFLCCLGSALESEIGRVLEENDYLRMHYDSAESILAEMRSVRYAGRAGGKSLAAPFVGPQLQICEAFGFGYDGDALSGSSLPSPSLSGAVSDARPSVSPAGSSLSGGVRCGGEEDRHSGFSITGEMLDIG